MMSFKLSKRKPFLLPGLLALTVMLTACSYGVNYVVVNESTQPIQVLIVRKKPNYGPSNLPPDLGVRLVSELEDQTPWRELQPSNVTFNPDTRTAVVTLMPQEALRVQSQKDVTCDDDDPRHEEGFYIEEIGVSGSSGAITLRGAQVRKSFVSGPRKSTCVLTYR